MENMEIRKWNQNSNWGKLGNTETSSEVKYFMIHNSRWPPIYYQHLRYYQDIICQTGKLT